MADPQKIQSLRDAFETWTDNDLLAQTFKYVEYSEQHIAAQQVLQQRKRDAEQRAAADALRIHQETLAQEERHHREQLEEQRSQFKRSIRVAWVGAAISIASAIAAFISAWYARTQALPSAQSPRTGSTISQPASEIERSFTHAKPD